MSTFVEVRRGAYRDSVSLMQVSRLLLRTDGVEAAMVAMATPLNLDVLAADGFAVPAGTGPNDLVVAIRAADDAALKEARDALELALAGPTHHGVTAAVTAGADPVTPPRTIGSAVDRLPGASLAFVSVPGRYAFVEAMEALAAGLHTVVFSDNVPVEAEVRLKEEGRRRGLLVMGPDCGTAVISGVGLGFANRVRRGPVGLVAASGTGAQQLMCLLDAAGVGVSHCLGVGGRDLSAEVGGRSTVQALAALDADAGTDLVVLVSKPPAAQVAEEVRAFAATLATPVLFALLGPEGDDLTTVAERAIDMSSPGAGHRVRGWPEWAPDAPPPPRRAGALRGLYCGGTLCDEAMVIAARALGPVASNIPLEPGWALGDDLRAPGHVMIDFGDDRLTEGRPHPMIDPGPRLDRLAAEVTAEDTGAVLLDVILGDGAHPDPAPDLVPVIRSSAVPVVACVVGTAADPQGLDRQAQTLRDAGAHVFLSNAAAARYAVGLVRGAGAAA